MLVRDYNGVQKRSLISKLNEILNQRIRKSSSRENRLKTFSWFFFVLFFDELMFQHLKRSGDDTNVFFYWRYANYYDSKNTVSLCAIQITLSDIRTNESNT